MSKEMQELQKQWHSVMQTIHSNANVGLDSVFFYIYKATPFVTMRISHPDVFKHTPNFLSERCEVCGKACPPTPSVKEEGSLFCIFVFNWHNPLR